MSTLCLDCGKYRHLAGQGLCDSCWKRHRRDGTLENFRLKKGATRPLGARPSTNVSPIEGATYRQVDFWVRRGYLRPDDAQPGSGYARQWSDEELAVGARMARLVAAGLTPAVASKVARESGPVVVQPGVLLALGSSGDAA